MDIRIGGGYRMSITDCGTGSRHGDRVEYIELVPNERISHKDRFEDETLAGDVPRGLEWAAPRGKALVFTIGGKRLIPYS